jgi:hypothetical protein
MSLMSLMYESPAQRPSTNLTVTYKLRQLSVEHYPSLLLRPPLPPPEPALAEEEVVAQGLQRWDKIHRRLFGAYHRLFGATNFN